MNKLLTFIFGIFFILACAGSVIASPTIINYAYDDSGNGIGTITNNVTYNQSKNYNFKTDDIFVTNCIGNNNWYAKYIEQGARLLIDNLWENKISKPSGYSIICKNWFWYNESLWYRNLGYNNYVRKSQISKKGLLLMHLKKPHRDFLFQNLNLKT